jgi:hypothetical protein
LQRHPEKIDGCFGVALASKVDATGAVDRLALAPPDAPGFFEATIDAISDTTLLAQAAHGPIQILRDAQTRLFSPSSISVGDKIYGLGTQMGKVSLKLSNGATVAAPRIRAACLEPHSLKVQAYQAQQFIANDLPSRIRTRYAPFIGRADEVSVRISGKHIDGVPDK